ncbi:MAG TPA: PocR ligand-binding domain-containing protein [Sphaerochaeta sp.]|nr:PocR ligand-binding domain-containing protein [Sphaerochaeta sp.]
MDQRKYLVFNPAVQKFVESYSYCFNVKITFFSLDLEELLVALHSASDDYCSLIQTNLQIRYRCLQQDRMICQQCKEQGQQLVYTCHGGLTEAVIPIELSGSLVCYALIGQFRTSASIPQSIAQPWLEHGFEFSVLEDAFLKRPLYDTTMLERMFDLFRVSLSLLIETNSLKLRQPDLIEKILMYIDDNIDKAIAIADVAKAVNRSPSSITHSLQAQIGLSFQKLLITKRLSNFERVILQDPTLQIQEAVRASGYEDPLYFSRLYKKYRGQSPRDFLSHAQVTNQDTQKRYLSQPLH